MNSGTRDGNVRVEREGVVPTHQNGPSCAERQDGWAAAATCGAITETLGAFDVKGTVTGFVGLVQRCGAAFFNQCAAAETAASYHRDYREKGAAFILGGALPSLIALSKGRARLRNRAYVPCAGARSFSADTPVLLADGTTKPIADITTNDWVYAAQSGRRHPDVPR